MPRARVIKPSFFTNEDVVSLRPETQLLFIGLWTLADREGRIEDRPLRIKMQVFPAADYDIDAMLDDLRAAGLVIRYIVEGARYIWLPTFKKHQNPHPNETPSVIPAYDPANEQQCNYASPHVKVGSARALPSSPSFPSDTSTSDTRNKSMSSEGSTGGGGDEVEVFTYWQQTTKHPMAQYTPKRKRAVKARLKEGYSVERLKRAIDGVLLSPHHQGQNDNRTIYDDLELICRDGEHVEMFERIANGDGVRGSPAVNGRFSQTRNTANNDRVIDEWVQKGAVIEQQ